MELVLGNFNGVEIKGKKPRRPKMRKVDGGRAPLILKINDDQNLTVRQQKRLNNNNNNNKTNKCDKNKTMPTNSEKNSKEDICSTISLTPIKLLSPAIELANHTTTNYSTNENENNAAYDVLQQLNTKNNDRWSIEKYDGQHYCINIHSIHDITDFIHTLSKMSLDSSMQAQFNDLNILSQSSRLPANEKYPINTNQPAVVKWEPIDLPYIHFHSELYTKYISSSAKDWPRFDSILPILLDDCVYSFMTCMNHYFPVQPKNLLISWYSSLTNPASDPLVLSIAVYWVRHVFIHHPMAQLKNVYNSTILDTVQTKLAMMTREALSNCFDEPHVHHIFALCLWNMTNTVSLQQKATNHMLAVRMASTLGIKPLWKDDNNNSNDYSKQCTKKDDEAELSNRLWWYLFQIDHFLTESGTISCSMLDPPSDDFNALSKLKIPSVCSLDEPDEIAGVHVWSNVLKIWMIRRRILKAISTINPHNEYKLSQLYDHALQELEQWTNNLPDMLKPEMALTPEHFSKYAEASLTISMEKCTYIGLISLRLLPRDGRVLTQLQHRAVLKMIDSSIELITTRQSVVAFAPCQTWPGDLKRSVQMLISCLKYGDPTIVSRSRLGLMRALRLLKSLAEVKWHDHICTSMLRKIERLLVATDNSNFNMNQIRLQEKDFNYDEDDEEEVDSQPSPPITSYIMDITPNSSVNSNSSSNHSESILLDQYMEHGSLLNSTKETIISEEKDEDKEKKSQFIPVNGDEKRSIKIANNLYEGIMMMDREMRPRPQYYNPNITAPYSALDDLIVTEDVDIYISP
ncbi:hypothetical protein BJ944DRAFT_246852 [Cunninghamella echinulata]|nr:hypothetical protein BJ944DRAFT_246852 [Cunninghamella echinulata]